jgi:hypothetical protein
VEGSADLQGKTVYRNVIPAEEYTQAFAYKHLVPVNEQLVLINAPLPYSLSFSVPKNKIFELTQGKESRIRVEVVRSKGFNENIQLQLLDAPDGISLRGNFLRGDNDKTMVSLRAESKVTPGMFENLILSGVASIPVDEKESLGSKIKKEKLFVTAPALTVVVKQEKQQGQQRKQEQEKQEEKKEK